MKQIFIYKFNDCQRNTSTSIKKILFRSLQFISLLFAFSFTTNVFAQSATVSTNASDYAPGQTVIITGSGWQPGENVQLVIAETPLLHPPIRCLQLLTALVIFTITNM